MEVVLLMVITNTACLVDVKSHQHFSDKHNKWSTGTGVWVMSQPPIFTVVGLILWFVFVLNARTRVAVLS